MLKQSYAGLEVLLPGVWWIAEKRIRAALLSDDGFAPAASREK